MKIYRLAVVVVAVVVVVVIIKLYPLEQQKKMFCFVFIVLLRSLGCSSDVRLDSEETCDVIHPRLQVSQKITSRN